ncbi:hypothetical protein [Erwinia phage Pecta]|nr:hypothetical protein [Erwinia phage Pecta]
MKDFQLGDEVEVELYFFDSQRKEVVEGVVIETGIPQDGGARASRLRVTRCVRTNMPEFVYQVRADIITHHRDKIQLIGALEND